MLPRYNGSDTRLKVVETAVMMAMRIGEEGQDGDSNEKGESWHQKAKVKTKQAGDLRKDDGCMAG